MYRKNKYLFICLLILIFALIPALVAANNVLDYSVYASEISVGAKKYDAKAIVNDICNDKHIEDQLDSQSKYFYNEKLYIRPSEYIVQNIQSKKFSEELLKINNGGLSDELFFENQYIYIPIFIDIDGKERIAGSIRATYDSDKNAVESQVHFYSVSKDNFVKNESYGSMEILYDAIDKAESENIIWVQLTEPMPNNGCILLIEKDGVYSVFDYQNVLEQAEGASIYSIEEFVSLRNLHMKNFYNAINRTNMKFFIKVLCIVLFFVSAVACIAVVWIMIKNKKKRLKNRG